MSQCAQLSPSSINDATTRTDHARAYERIAALESHLSRIAAEVRAAGITTADRPLLDLERFSELADLTPRQWEVTERLLRGQRVPTIAKEMFLSASTIRNHLSVIYRKFSVNSQDALIRKLQSGRDDSA